MKGQETGEERTVKFFKSKFGKEISLEEARQINERVSIVFRLLARWDRNNRKLSADSGGLKTG